MESGSHPSVVFSATNILNPTLSVPSEPGQLRYEDSFSTDPWQNTSQPMPDPAANPPMRIAYEYDRLGRKVNETVTPGTGLEYGTSYDNEGRIAAVSSPEGVVHYEYDSRTGLKTATWTGTNINSATTKTDYEYDDLGRLKKVKLMRRNNADVNPPEETSYTYNDNGSRESVKLPNGVYTQYQYNAMNRLTEGVNLQAQPQSGQPMSITLSRFGYGHYADGQRATAWERQKHADPNMVVMANSRGFRYDGLNRLTYESNYDDGWPHSNRPDPTRDFGINPLKQNPTYLPNLS
jgi:YD repeat-containing protein